MYEISYSGLKFDCESTYIFVAFYFEDFNFFENL